MSIHWGATFSAVSSLVRKSRWRRECLPCLSVRRSGRCWACWLDIMKAGGSADHAHLRCVVCLPGILLAIAVVAVLGSGIANVIIAVAIFFHPRVCPAGARQHAGVETANLYRVSTQYWCQRYDHFVASYLARPSLLSCFHHAHWHLRLSLPPACHFGPARSRHQSGEQCSMRHERIWLSRRMSLFFPARLFSDRTGVHLLGDGLRDDLEN